MYALYYHYFYAVVDSYEQAEELLVEHFGFWNKDDLFLEPINR
jgi:hypothetical protein